MTYFHVTFSVNRQSIERHGLDWTRMSAASGIAGSRSPEQAGCFLCGSVHEVEWFIRMGSTRGPVDVWEVEGIDESMLVESPERHHYIPSAIPPDRLRLVRRDVQVPWTQPISRSHPE